MNTELLVVDAQYPDPALIERAAHLLRNGELVAFPTETVYGLGANALNVEAVQAIFTAKGRPGNNPLIVHIGDTEAAKQLASEWTDNAQKLAAKFWPGPLTLVVRKRAHIPDIVSGGGPTVALRVPSHPIALAVIKSAGVPIAAPSANRSSCLSPTLAAHVFKHFKGLICVILDGGPTSGGLESTVVDVTVSPPRLLRPGLIAVDNLRAILGALEIAGSPDNRQTAPPRSPGMIERHYAPQTPLECCADSLHRVTSLCQDGKRVGWLCFADDIHEVDNATRVRMPNASGEYASRLYAVLHELDALRLDRIVVERPPEEEEWRAVRDRLHRAAQTFAVM